MLPTPVFLPGEFHGQRSLAGYSPWGCKESDTTERASQGPFPSAGDLVDREMVSCFAGDLPMDCNLPGFSLHGIFQARILE